MIFYERIKIGFYDAQASTFIFKFYKSKFNYIYISKGSKDFPVV